MKFGIKETQLEQLSALFAEHLPEEAEIYVYGSRAKSTYHERSDLDLVIKNIPADRHRLSALQAAIDESNFPLLCDLQYYNEVNNPALKDHIDRRAALLSKNVGASLVTPAELAQSSQNGLHK